MKSNWLFWAGFLLGVSFAGCSREEPHAETDASASSSIGVPAVPPQSSEEREARLAEVKEQFQHLETRGAEDLLPVDRGLVYNLLPEDKVNTALVEFLRTQSRSPSKIVSFHAVVALATLQEDAPYIFDRLVLELQTNPEGPFRSAAAVGLGHLGDKRAIPYLEAALQDEYSTPGHVSVALVQSAAKNAIRNLNSGYVRYNDPKVRVIRHLDRLGRERMKAKQNTPNRP